MTKICLLSDIHLSDRPPSSCTDGYQDDLFDLLEQARELCAERGMPMVWAGDTFHHKAPSRVSHRLVHRTCEFIARCTPNFPVLVLAGNHDMSNDRYESLTESQPLGMLFRAGAQELKGWGSPFKIYGVPWIQGYGAIPEEVDGKVREALRPFKDAVAHELTTQRGARLSVPPHPRPTDNPYLIVAHSPLYPPGRELQYEFYPAEWWADAMGMQGYVFYGHVHEPHGEYSFYDERGGVTFCNNGALSRGSLHEYNLERQVGVTLWDDQTGEFEFVPLDARPASEVFRLTEKQQAVDVQGRLDDFLQTAGTAQLEVCNVESVIAHVKTLGLGRPVEDLVEELLRG